MTIQPAPTQVAYPWKAVLRTIVQNLVVLVPLVNSVAVATFDYLNKQTDIVVHPVAFLILNGVIAVTAVAIGLVTRIMSIPGVNGVLTKLGIGATPAKG